jgi:hypothetical protein
VRGVKLELKQLDRVDLSSHPHGEIWNTFAGLFYKHRSNSSCAPAKGAPKAPPNFRAHSPPFATNMATTAK